MAFARRALSGYATSTLLMACVVPVMLGILSGNKPDAILGIGTPEMEGETSIVGGNISPAKVKEIGLLGTYSPLVEDLIIEDATAMGYRSGNADVSRATYAGYTAIPNLTATVVNGTITDIGITGISGVTFSGATPTLKAIDAVGSCGYGEDLVPVINGSGVMTSITVRNGGFNFSSTGTVYIKVYATYLNNVPIGTEGQRYARPLFKMARVDTTKHIYQSDIDAVKNMGAVNIEEGDGAMSMVDNAMRNALATQMQRITREFWSAYPTTGINDPATVMLDQPYGLLHAIDDGSGAHAYYAGVDRTNVDNYWWRSPTDTSDHRGIGFKDFVNDMNLKKGLTFKGGGPDLVVVNPNDFGRWKDESISYTQNVNITGEMAEFAKYGIRFEVIKYGNTFAVPDYRCPAGTSLGINSKAVAVAFRAGYKFTPTPLWDARKVPSGGFDGWFFRMATQWMPMVIAPPLCVKYTRIS